jgi:uncharacterized protein
MRPVALTLALGLAAAPALARGATPVPPLTGPVVDAAGLLDGASVRRLESLSRAARGGGKGPQLQYLVVRSLEGEPIEDYSIRVAEAWRIGTKGKDDGVLVTVAVEDRAVRIEVGGGIEGGLTDVQSSRIIRGTIAPEFREGRYGDGLYDAGVQILSALGALPADVRERARRPRGVTGLPLGAGPLFALLVVFWIVGNVFRGFGPRRRRQLWWGGGPFMGGGWGGGGGFGGRGGGGGWSGGGGGFSGGGASGRW